MLSLCETPQYGDTIVADRSDSQAPITDSLQVFLQLDQLRFAERSPVGGTIENQDHAVWSGNTPQVLHLAILIEGFEVPGFRSYIRTDLNLLPREADAA